MFLTPKNNECAKSNRKWKFFDKTVTIVSYNDIKLKIKLM